MLREREVFGTYHPVINFLFFISVIVFGMFFIHPAFLVCSVALSAMYLITVRGKSAFKLIVILIFVFAAVTLVNPLIDPHGQHVLFRWLGGRAYTLEALRYGMAIGAMFITIIMWFASYNSIMTSDKFLFIFGRAAPSITTVLTMVLRLVPNFKKKAVQIAGARKSIGKAGGNGVRDNINNGTAVVSSMMSWALEGGIVTSDSMKSRGFGTFERTSFSVYRFDSRDLGLMIILIILIVIVAVCSLNGAAKTFYVPETVIHPIDNVYSITGITAYGLLLAVPTALNIMEAMRWHISRSGI